MNEEELEGFDQKIGMHVDPGEHAREALRQYQEEAGMTFDDPDAPAGPSANYVPPDEEIPGEWMGSARRDG